MKLLKGKHKKALSQFQIDSYPAGTFIHTEKGWYYVFNETKRLPIITDRVLNSWSPPVVVETQESNPAVQKLKVGIPLKFRNGSLLYSHASGRMYLISQGKLRHITNPDVVLALGYRLLDAIWVSLDEINLHEKGEPLNG